MFFVSSRRRHTRCALVTGVQTCALPISLRARLDKRRNAGISEIRAAAERQAYFGCPRCGVWDGDIAPLKPRHLFLHNPSPTVIGKDTADPRQDRKSTRLNSSH